MRCSPRSHYGSAARGTSSSTSSWTQTGPAHWLQVTPLSPGSTFVSGLGFFCGFVPFLRPSPRKSVLIDSIEQKIPPPFSSDIFLVFTIGSYAFAPAPLMLSGFESRKILVSPSKRKHMSRLNAAGKGVPVFVNDLRHSLPQNKISAKAKKKMG